MNILDQWEAEAKKDLVLTTRQEINLIKGTIEDIEKASIFIEHSRRIIALIDLVRKKDEVLKQVDCNCDSHSWQHCRSDCLSEIAEEALTLTESLK